MHEGPGIFRGHRAAYRTNLTQMVKTRATYTAHMPGKCQFLVQGHPQVPHSSGKQDTREAFQQDGKINLEYRSDLYSRICTSFEAVRLLSLSLFIMTLTLG